MDMLIIWTTSVSNYTQELLQFYRNETRASHDACENNEDDFIDIMGVKLVL